MNILSSQENSMYRREEYMQTVPSQEYNGEPWIDPLDPRLQDLISKALPGATFKFKGEPITTISHKFYGNTTLYWLILTYNGYLFADDIPYGTDLKIPDISSIAKHIRPGQPKKNRTGTVVKA